MKREEMQRMDASQLDYQEQYCRQEFEKFYGKNRTGFCDVAMDGIDSIIIGMYLRIPETLNAKKEHLDQKSAVRSLGYYHYNRVSYAFKAAYNLAVEGYLTESATILRTIIETFVRLLYIEKFGTIEDVVLALAGHNGKDGRRFNVSYRNQFDKVSPGLYHFYQVLCDIAHGALAATFLRTNENFEEDTGIVFKGEMSSFIVNQFSMLMFAHLNHLVKLYPEIKEKADSQFETKSSKALERLLALHFEIKTKGANEKWMNALEGILNL